MSINCLLTSWYVGLLANSSLHISLQSHFLDDGKDLSIVNGGPAKNKGVQAYFNIWAPKWGFGPPRGPFEENFEFF